MAVPPTVNQEYLLDAIAIATATFSFTTSAHGSRARGVESHRSGGITNGIWFVGFCRVSLASGSFTRQGSPNQDTRSPFRGTFIHVRELGVLGRRRFVPTTSGG